MEQSTFQIPQFIIERHHASELLIPERFCLITNKKHGGNNAINLVAAGILDILGDQLLLRCSQIDE